MMTRWVLCFDGTWNDQDGDQGDGETVTNVVRLYRALGEDADQHKWYDAGVGSGLPFHFTGGAFGLGLDLKIRQGYKLLSRRYRDGDAIYLLGFSRGAYTARSLAGLIGRCGLLDPDQVDDDEQNPYEQSVRDAYTLYWRRDRVPPGDRQALDAITRRAAIHFLGVWDTVGSLGIPDDVPLGTADDAIYRFHDTRLDTALVGSAFHALAIDEHRVDYAATLWDQPNQPGVYEQVWFAGAHADVGGGYRVHRLADIALHWMAEKARSRGLDVDDALLPPLPVLNDKDRPTDSFSTFLDGAYAKAHGGQPYFRPVDKAALHPSVPRLMAANPGYRPPNA
jgi:uncharacterized protein (DUF2235 family)